MEHVRQLIKTIPGQPQSCMAIWFGTALLAVAFPTLLSFSVAPSATFLNQAASLVGWSIWLLAMSVAQRADELPDRKTGLVIVVCASACLAAAALACVQWRGLPATIALSAAGLIAVAAIATASGTATRRFGHAEAAFTALTLALTLAGLLNTLIGILQVYAPEVTGGPLIAASSATGRAVGNLRQPNHLSSLLLWAIIAVAWLGDSGRLPRLFALGTALLMMFGLVLTGSRTGMLGTLLLAAWGALDRRQSRGARIALGLAPLVYALFWLAVSGWAHGHGASFAGEAQLHKADISSSRFAIWANTLSLISAHPWFGVGFGEFNFAWTLTPFPDRPTAFFDHTHNLILQFAVELGLPLATLVLALLALALREAWRNARDAPADEAPALRAALVMVLMIGLHSLLEYPLWYAYFLLPTAFAFGLCLGGAPGVVQARDTPPAPAPRMRLNVRAVGALLMLAGSVYAVVDYWRVVVIFAPPANAAPLAQRVIEGRRSVFFGHHADYAAATVAPHPSRVMAAFDRATHFLLDTRLMMAWAKALNEAGDVDRARHLAARLREFRNPQSAEFFAPCDKPPAEGEALPFQCEPPQRRYDYRDFR